MFSYIVLTIYVNFVLNLIVKNNLNALIFQITVNAPFLYAQNNNVQVLLYWSFVTYIGLTVNRADIELISSLTLLHREVHSYG